MIHIKFLKLDIFFKSPGELSKSTYIWAPIKSEQFRAEPRHSQFFKVPKVIIMCNQGWEPWIYIILLFSMQVRLMIMRFPVDHLSKLVWVCVYVLRYTCVVVTGTETWQEWK